MKARSPKLAQYLESTGALYGGPEDIARAKIEYRKQYKAEHKKKAPKLKELRPQFNSNEYAVIEEKAAQLGMSLTGYIKAVAITAEDIAPHKNTLLEVLQKVSMVAIQLERTNHHSASLLTDAEHILSEYLRKH